MVPEHEPTAILAHLAMLAKQMAHGLAADVLADLAFSGTSRKRRRSTAEARIEDLAGEWKGLPQPQELLLPELSSAEVTFTVMALSDMVVRAQHCSCI